MDGSDLMSESTPLSKMKPNPGEVKMRFSSFVKYNWIMVNGGNLRIRRDARKRASVMPPSRTVNAESKKSRDELVIKSFKSLNQE